jgi:hypothetical protein
MKLFISKGDNIEIMDKGTWGIGVERTTMNFSMNQKALINP